MRADRRIPGERGSVLLLMPAAFLVLLLLGAIVVDFSVRFLGQKEAADAAMAAANDAASAAIDVTGFRANGRVVIDCDAASVVVQEAFEARRASWLHDAVIELESCEGDRITVEASATVEFIFAKAIPGAPHTGSVHATAVARATSG